MDCVLKNIGIKKETLEKELSIFEKIKFIAHFISQVILYSLFSILILIAICYVLYFFDMIHNIKSGDVKPPLFNAYIIVSPSMVPTIKVKDAIVIKRQEANTLKVGDIITFNSSDPRYSGITITHRIVAIEKATDGTLLFKTKGDGNNSEDSAFAKEKDIYGKVILNIPKLGYIQYFLSQSYGWLLAIVIPCLSVISYDIVKLLKSLGINLFGKKKKERDVIETLDYTDNGEIETLESDNNDDILEILDGNGNSVKINLLNISTINIDNNIKSLDYEINNKNDSNNNVEVLNNNVEELFVEKEKTNTIVENLFEDTNISSNFETLSNEVENSNDDVEVLDFGDEEK